MHKFTHDIVIGDLGREATVRYIKLFSDYERQIISKNRNSKVFYDELRLIRYSIIGGVRELKESYLPLDDDDLSECHLIGLEGGIDSESMYIPILKFIIPYIRIAIELGAENIRIIIPCNSLASVASRLNNVFRSRRNLFYEMKKIKYPAPYLNWLLDGVTRIKITVPSIVASVVEEIARRNINHALLIGTKAALKEYQKLGTAHPGNLNFEPYIGTDKKFTTLLQDFVAGKSKDEMLFPSFKIITGCTDIEYHGSIDSLKIFTKSLVEDIYGDK